MMRRIGLRFPNGIPRAAMSDNPAQADINAVTVTDNSDLRDRIAKVLHRQYGPSLGAAEGGWDREPLGTQEMYLADADAVIDVLIDMAGRGEHDHHVDVTWVPPGTIAKWLGENQ